MDNLDELVCELIPRLRSLGYRKNRLNWYKNKGKHSLLFAIQKSQYARDSWHCVYGVCLHDITTRPATTLSACQITYRVDYHLSAGGFADLLESWELRLGDLRQLQRLAVEGKLPGIANKESVRYLSMIDVTKI